MSDRRADALAIWWAGVRASDPAEAVRRHLLRDGPHLTLGAERLHLGSVRRLRVVGAGKAASAMAAAVEDLLGARIEGGMVLVPHGSPTTAGRIERWPAAHPLPDAAGVEGTAALLEGLADLGPEDRVLALISGGASSLLAAPAGTLTLDDLRGAGEVLLGSGLPIAAANAVRKHLSRVTGGWLAAHVHPARCWSLVLSDVPGDDPSVVGSGPTTGDPTTYAEAIDHLRDAGAWDAMPPAVREHLTQGAAGTRPETPAPGSSWLSRSQTVLIGGPGQAAAAAAREAVRRGYPAEILGTALSGDATDLGRTLAHRLGRMEGPAALIGAGETTVRLPVRPGRGGRNQQLALAAAGELAGRGDRVLLAAGTDGIDGPTPDAGGLVDGTTLLRARTLGLDPDDALRRCDAGTLLGAVSDRITTGPTGTNVTDLYVGLVGPGERGRT